MKAKIPAIALLALALSACSAERSPDTATDAAPAMDPAGSAATASPPPLDQPAQDVPPATAPMPGSLDEPPGNDLVRWDGYGDMRFGMSAAEAQRAWGGELTRRGGASDVCYFLTPKWVQAPSELAFMIENDSFVRYGTESDKMTAPGGGRNGMSADEIRTLYADVEQTPHKYVEGGLYLGIQADNGDGKLVFEVEADGTVSEWRVGVPPQVDYVEGCA